jgi:phage gp36-like protein
MAGFGPSDAMSYIVNQDIVDRVGVDRAVQLSSDSGTAVNTNVLDEVRLSSEGEVNGYLAKRYAVPVDLTAHPDLDATLSGFTLDIAVYRLMLRRPPVPEDIRRAYDNAVKWLVAVSKGEVILPADTPPASATADAPTIDWGSSEQNAAMLRDL